MSTTPPSASAPQNRSPWLVTKVAENPSQTGWILYALGILLVLVPILLGIFYHTEYLWVCIWGALVALECLGLAIWQTVRPGSMDEHDHARGLLLLAGGLFGLSTTLLGFGLGYDWWDVFTSWINGTPEKGWRIYVVLLAIVGGLGIMFASLQLGRSQERTNPGLRVLLYGYNAVLMGL